MSLAVPEQPRPVGLAAPEVSVEVHLANGLPAFTLVGLPDVEVRGARDRVRAALQTSQFEFPQRRITVNPPPPTCPRRAACSTRRSPRASSPRPGRSPADAPSPTTNSPASSLSGELRPCAAPWPLARQAAERGRPLILPAANAAEAALVECASPSQPAPSLLAVVAHLCRHTPSNPTRPAPAPPPSLPRPRRREGQVQARRARSRRQRPAPPAFYGPPGTGKSMLAQRLPGPPAALSDAEAPRPRRSIRWRAALPRADASARSAPHHSAPLWPLVGGGSTLRPGRSAARPQRRAVPRRRAARVRPARAEAPARAPRERPSPSPLRRLAGRVFRPASSSSGDEPRPWWWLPRPPGRALPMHARADACHRGKLSGLLLDRIDLRPRSAHAAGGRDLQAVAAGEASAAVRSGSPAAARSSSPARVVQRQPRRRRDRSLRQPDAAGSKPLQAPSSGSARRPGLPSHPESRAYNRGHERSPDGRRGPRGRSHPELPRALRDASAHGARPHPSYLNPSRSFAASTPSTGAPRARTGSCGSSGFPMLSVAATPYRPQLESYSSGERAGLRAEVFPRRAGCARPWKASWPSVAPIPAACRDLSFTVRDDKARHRDQRRGMGKRVALSYDQHLGIPSHVLWGNWVLMSTRSAPWRPGFSAGNGRESWPAPPPLPAKPHASGTRQREKPEPPPPPSPPKIHALHPTGAAAGGAGHGSAPSRSTPICRRCTRSATTSAPASSRCGRPSPPTCCRWRRWCCGTALSDAWGRKRVIVASMLLFALASLVCVFAGSIDVLLVGGALQGISAGAGMVVAAPWCATCEGAGGPAPDEPREHDLRLGPALAPMLGGWIFAAFGWRAVFFFLAPARLAGRRHRPAAPRNAAAGGRQPLHPVLLARRYGQVFSTPGFMLLTLPAGWASTPTSSTCCRRRCS